MSQDAKVVWLEGLPTLLKVTFAFVDSLALKCAIELGIADIIDTYGGPITLSEIASHLKPQPCDLTFLPCLMQLLVRAEIFTIVNREPNCQKEVLYWLTPASRLILQNGEVNTSYAPMVLMHTHRDLLTPWHYLSHSIKEGGVAFEKAHGHSMWEYLSIDREFNKTFHNGLACTAKIGFKLIASEYKDVFVNVGSVVDVGGGTGATTAEIARAYPHIKVINFDLPHVIAIAPEYPGVAHVEGDMFKDIPNADLVVLKSILHDWSDEDCVKILKNCRKAIPKRGKLIIFEQLAQQEEGVEDVVSSSTLMMIVHLGAGKERTRHQCGVLLENAGFPRYNLIRSPGLPAIIEAHPS